MKDRLIWRYTRNGILFGLSFPIAATLWEVFSQGVQLSFQSILQVQLNNPLIWMIDTAPVFLGVFAFFTGRNQARAVRLNAELEMRIQERDEMLDELQDFKISQATDIQKQIAQLQASAQVARQATSTHDLDQILDKTVQLISEQFGYYHAGIFMVDETGRYAELRATNSEGGRRMLDKGHKLEVGFEGIVGHTASSGEPRIALDVGADAVFFDNPDLPLTRSEMALPLKVVDRVIGVLDVQSVQEKAFDEQDLAILQTLADQVALAIENARLLAGYQRALDELEATYNREIHLAWQQRLANHPLVFSYDPSGIKAAPPDTRIGSPEDDGLLEVPIRLRGQRIGSLQLRRNGVAGPWKPEDRQLVTEVGDQIALALENARLIDEVQQRALQEQLVSQISNKAQSSLDLDTVMKSTVIEIGRILGASKVQIRLNANQAAADLTSLDPGVPSRS